MGMTTVLNAAGVDKDRFVDYTEKNPATYKVRFNGSNIVKPLETQRKKLIPYLIYMFQDWSRTWDQETTGKEDSLRSPYLDTEFEKAREGGGDTGF